VRSGGKADKSICKAAAVHNPAISIIFRYLRNTTVFRNDGAELTCVGHIARRIGLGQPGDAPLSASVYARTDNTNEFNTPSQHSPPSTIPFSKFPGCPIPSLEIAPPIC
jgi:hypothetical protein